MAKRPYYRLESVREDGSKENPELYDLKRFNSEWKMSRRGFIGLASVISALCVGCGREEEGVVIEETQENKGKGTHSKGIKLISFSPSGKLLATLGEENELKLWDLATGRKRILSISDSTDTFAFKSDNEFLAITYNKEAGSNLTQINLVGGMTDRVTMDLGTPFISPSGKFLVDLKDNKVNIYHIPSNSLIGNIKLDAPFIHYIGMSTPVFSLDESFFACVTKKNTSIIDLKRCEVAGIIEESCCVPIGFSPDGRILILAFFDENLDKEEIKLWNVKENIFTEIRKTMDNRFISCAAFSIDGKFLAVGGSFIEILDPLGGNLIASFGDIEEMIGDNFGSGGRNYTYMVFSPDSKILAAGGFCTVRLLDVTTGDIVLTLLDEFVNCCCLPSGWRPGCLCDRICICVPV